jgi:Tfp pilus assembly protein PilN
MTVKESVQEAGLADETTIQKISLIQQHQKDSRNVIIIVNKLAGIIPENIRLNKINITPNGDVILDCVSADANNFNQFAKTLKQEALFEEVNLQNFSSAASGQKAGTIKVKLRR